MNRARVASLGAALALGGVLVASPRAEAGLVVPDSLAVREPPAVIDREVRAARVASTPAWLSDTSLGREGGAGERPAVAAITPEPSGVRGEHGPRGIDRMTRGPMPPLARGGGPLSDPRGERPVALSQVVRIDDHVEGTQLSQPIRCATVTAVGTPAVRNVAFEFVGADGSYQAVDRQRGRSESVRACPDTAQPYQLRVRVEQGRPGVAAAQLFVD